MADPKHVQLQVPVIRILRKEMVKYREHDGTSCSGGDATLSVLRIKRILRRGGMPTSEVVLRRTLDLLKEKDLITRGWGTDSYRYLDARLRHNLKVENETLTRRSNLQANLTSERDAVGAELVELLKTFGVEARYDEGRYRGRIVIVSGPHAEVIDETGLPVPNAAGSSTKKHDFHTNEYFTRLRTLIRGVRRG